MKLYDITAVTGEYTTQDGQTKKRYQNVGVVMQGRDGGQYIMLERWFNPAGLPDPQGRGSVILSCFEPRQRGQQSGGYDQRPPQGGYGGGGRPNNDLNDEIPFGPEVRI